MAEKSNLRDIFRRLKRRRLKLLKFIKRGVKENSDHRVFVPINNLTDLLTEIKSNEEHLIEYSTELLKNDYVRGPKFKDFVNSSTSEIRSSLHWLDVISSYYYKKGKTTD